jgi:CPA1 family monovalent cation:H+ antiporter
MTGAFSLAQAGISFVLVAAGGVALGLLIGMASAAILRRMDDPVFTVVLTFLFPVAAYLPAEIFGLSGVL